MWELLIVKVVATVFSSFGLGAVLSTKLNKRPSNRIKATLYDIINLFGMNIWGAKNKED
jgi:hypothetical protein